MNYLNLFLQSIFAEKEMHYQGYLTNSNKKYTAEQLLVCQTSYVQAYELLKYNEMQAKLYMPRFLGLEIDKQYKIQFLPSKGSQLSEELYVIKKMSMLAEGKKADHRYIQEEVVLPKIEKVIRFSAAGKVSPHLPFKDMHFEILCKHAKKIDDPSTNGNTALHWAVKGNRPSYVQILLEKGADCNVQNILKETPLHFAAELDSDYIAKLLLEKKAFTFLQDKKGDTPLHRAQAKNKTACINLLSKVI